MQADMQEQEGIIDTVHYEDGDYVMEGEQEDIIDKVRIVDGYDGTNEEQEAIIDQVLYEDGGGGSEEEQEDIIDQVLYEDDTDGKKEEQDHEAIIDQLLYEDGGGGSEEEQGDIIDQVLYEDGDYVHEVTLPGEADPPRVAREILFKHAGWDGETEDDDFRMPLGELCLRHDWAMELFVDRFAAFLGGPWIGRVRRITGVRAFFCLKVYPDGEKAEADPMHIYECGNPSSTPQWDGMMMEKMALEEERVASMAR
ncbi:unnamed protein product [Prorocentrum cordatum]|uniref:Uncharacterized protein n=1 Tax=Prorocentrum cordatum TaxID=2364126 RepID=A0ABN9S2R2_9DINO|nr:unnamed protein product [Polarella glacialis]